MGSRIGVEPTGGNGAMERRGCREKRDGQNPTSEPRHGAGEHDCRVADHRTHERGHLDFASAKTAAAQCPDPRRYDQRSDAAAERIDRTTLGPGPGQPAPL